MVNRYKLGLTVLQQEIVGLLFAKAGMSLNQRQIAKHLNVSPPAVIKAIPELKRLELIKVSQDKESRRWAIELNRENHRVIQLKRAENLKVIYESGLADFVEKEFAGATIILFGSYSRGDDTFNSDIDLAVIGRKHKEVSVKKFEDIIEKKININFYDSFDKIHKNLRENLFNGITLYGGIEL